MDRTTEFLFGKGQDSEYGGLGQKITEHFEKEAKLDVVEKQPNILEVSPTATVYLNIEDMKQPEYKYDYISSNGQEFVDAMVHLNSCKIVGFDTEFITSKGKTIATYLQISSLERGFVFNLQNNYDETHFKDMIAHFMKNANIKKVGFSIYNDKSALNTAFNHELEFSSFLDLSSLLFTTVQPTMGLSHICNRLYGRSLDKQAQTTVAEYRDLVDSADIQYAAFDALVPISVYTDMRSCIDAAPADLTHRLQTRNEGRRAVVLDPSCKSVRQLLDKKGVEVTVADNYTYKQISEECKKLGAILITCDKYQICNKEDFPNVIVFTTLTSFKKGNLY